MRATLVGILLVVLTMVARPARADEPSAEATARAREEYARGNTLAKQEDWAAALSAFQRSNELRPHPSTVYNIATCHRVLGQYTAARRLFTQVLSSGQIDQLPEALVTNARGYKEEADRVVARVRIVVTAATEIAVDGRPLATESTDGVPTLVAGVLPPGPGRPVPSTFDLLVDPGTRVLLLSQKGHKDIVRAERFAPGAREERKFDLEKLPATLRITANVEHPIVTVNGVDVGMAPVDVPRVAGKYRVKVAKDGFVPHEMVVNVEPGEDPKLDAKLVQEKTPITKKWWFWAGAAAIIGGGVAITYAVTRPEPQPPDYQRGSSGWLVELGK